MTSPQIYGLIGNPVKHSLSPLMHNAAFKSLKINAEYRLFELKDEEVAPFLKGLAAKNIFGLNVTIPYKAKVIPLLDKVDKEASAIGAVNTVLLKEGKLEGFNTDGAGFIRHLKEDLKFGPRGKNIAVLGAGGAGKAVAYYLAKSGAKSIAIFDIYHDKAQALVNEVKGSFPKADLKAALSARELGIDSAQLLVNTTPLGMKESDASPVDADLINKNTLVYDLIYNPAESKLLKSARAKGAETANGLGMLLYQGVLAFEIWAGQKAPVEVMRNALKGGAC